MRGNCEARQTHGSGKLYRKETNFPISWMKLRKYAMTSIRTVLATTSTTRMILSMGVLRCHTKVYTLPRRSGYVVVPMGFEEDELGMVLNQRLTKTLQSTDCLHISIPCTSARLTPGGDMHKRRTDSFRLESEIFDSYGWEYSWRSCTFPTGT